MDERVKIKVYGKNAIAITNMEMPDINNFEIKSVEGRIVVILTIGNKWGTWHINIIVKGGTQGCVLYVDTNTTVVLEITFINLRRREINEMHRKEH